MDQVIEDKFNKVIRYLANISKSLKSSSNNSSDKKKADLGYKVSSGGGDSTTNVDNTNKPREILDKQNIIDDYGPEARKFWEDLFAKYFGSKDEKQDDSKLKKPKSFWEKILSGLAVIAAVALGAINKIIEFFKNLKLLDAIKKFFSELRLLDKIKNFFKELKLVERIKRFFRGLKTKFIAQLKKSKLGRAILRAYIAVSKKIRSIFRSIVRGFKAIKSGKIGTLFGKVVSGLGRVFGSLFRGIKAGVKAGFKIFTTILKAVKGVFKAIGTVGKFFPTLVKAFKFGGKLVGKLFLPLTILLSIFDLVDGIMTGIRKEGLSFGSAIKGFATGIVKILTLGFIDTETIYDAFTEINEQIAGWIESVMNIPEKIMGFFKEKYKGFKKFFGMGETEDEKYEALKQQYDKITNKKDAERTPEEQKIYKQFVEETTKRNVRQKANDFISRPNEPTIPFNSQDTIIGFKDDGPLALLSKQSVDTQKEHLDVAKSMSNIIQQAVNQLIILNDNLIKHVKPSQNLVLSAPKVSNYSNQSGSSQTAFRQGAFN